MKKIAALLLVLVVLALGAIPRGVNAASTDRLGSWIGTAADVVGEPGWCYATVGESAASNFTGNISSIDIEMTGTPADDYTVSSYLRFFTFSVSGNWYSEDNLTFTIHDATGYRQMVRGYPQCVEYLTLAVSEGEYLGIQIVPETTEGLLVSVANSDQEDVLQWWPDEGSEYAVEYGDYSYYSGWCVHLRGYSSLAGELGIQDLVSYTNETGTLLTWDEPNEQTYIQASLTGDPALEPPDTYNSPYITGTTWLDANAVPTLNARTFYYRTATLTTSGLWIAYSPLFTINIPAITSGASSTDLTPLVDQLGVLGLLAVEVLAALALLVAGLKFRSALLLFVAAIGFVGIALTQDLGPIQSVAGLAAAAAMLLSVREALRAKI